MEDYQLVLENGEVKVYCNGQLRIDQPLDPRTGESWQDEQEAKQWVFDAFGIEVA